MSTKHQIIFDSDQESIDWLMSTTVDTGEGWKAARPMMLRLSNRLRAAWLVLKGEACAVRWY